MAIQEELRSLPSWGEQESLHDQREHSRQRRSVWGSLALGMMAAASALVINSDQAAAIPAPVSPTATAHASLLTVGVYPAVETAQISADADNGFWLYKGIVQLSYAGLIAWVIALLRESGK